MSGMDWYWGRRRAYDFKALEPAFTGCLGQFALVIQGPRFRTESADLHGLTPNATHWEPRHLHVLCQHCHDITKRSGLIYGSRTWVTRTIEKYTHHASLEELENTARRGCHLCSLIFQTLPEHWLGSIVPHENRAEPLALCILRIQGKNILELRTTVGGRGRRALNTVSTERSCRKSTLLTFRSSNLMNEADMESFPTLRYSYTGSETHMKLVRYWLDQCIDHHLYCGERWTKFVPSRLLKISSDAQESGVSISLCETVDETDEVRAGIRYCTLSHRWGSGDALQLTTRNIAAFRAGIPFDILPRTFQDAIIITMCLGQNYLWIDSLCIKQDSPDDWAKESATMGAIYENSLCNIAAHAAYTAEDGCFQERRPLTYVPCRIAGSGNDCLYVAPCGTSPRRRGEDDGESALTSRAWVFQERLLARRTVHFSSREISWTCRLGSADERKVQGTEEKLYTDSQGPLFGDFAFEARQERRLTTQIPDNARAYFEVLRSPDDYMAEARIDPRFEDFRSTTQNLDKVDIPKFRHHWFQIVETYTKCDLTRSEDRLIALSGIAQRVVKASGFVYVAGLWEEVLISSLCWSISSRHQARPCVYMAPTWSWASVEGTVVLAYGGPSEPKAEMVTYSLQTHPSDKDKTGKVSAGSLVLCGHLKMASDFIFKAPQMHVSGRCYTLYQCGQEVAHLHPDTILTVGDMEQVYLFPVLHTTPRRNAAWNLVGLALTLKQSLHESEISFERIGLFTFNFGGVEGRLSAWFDDAVEQQILIR